MYKILNNFYRSKAFDNLPKILTRKLFKIFKIFFVETDLITLPENNHPTNLDKDLQTKIIKNEDDKFYRPFSTCFYLLEILSLYSKANKNFSFFDFGANNIDNFIYLNRYLKNWRYIYHDLPHYNDVISNLVKEKGLKNISVSQDLSLEDKPLDFAFFGSSLHYVQNYKEVLKKFFNNKTKNIILSHTPFHISNIKKNDIVLKQVNIHPVINYAYLFQYNNFITFMKDNNYILISQNKNNLIKFLNFKNFSSDFSFISFLDLTFSYKNNDFN